MRSPLKLSFKIQPWLDFALCAIGVIWSGIGFIIHGNFRAAENLAHRNTANLAQTLESQIAGRVDTIDATLRFAQVLFARDPVAFVLGPWSEVGRDPRDVLAVFVDAEGFGRAAGGQPLPMPLDLRDSPSIAAHLAAPSNAELRIGHPMAGPITGRPIIAFSRALHRADGGFGGVMVLAVGIGLFSQLQQALDLEDGRILIAGLDGEVRARAPETFGSVGLHLPDQVLAPFLAGEIEVSERAPSAVDGVDSFVTRRRVGGYPLLVAVGIPADLMLARARLNRDAWLALGVLLTLLAIVLQRVVVRQEQVEKNARAALDGTFANIGHGIMMIDAAGRVVVANDQVSRLLGLPPRLVARGRPIADMVAWLNANAESGGASTQTQGDRITAALDRVPHGWEHTLPDGSVLQVRVEHLANGSFVFSWTDVTEARRLATALADARDAAEAAWAELVAAFEEAPFGIALMSADRRLEFMNPIAVAMLDLPAELVRPDTKGADILRFQIERGDLAMTPKLVAAANRALLHPSEERGTYERLTRDGRMIEVRISTLPEGRMIRTYADISYRHAALREHARAREAAEAALRSRNEFIASASEDLRTPIYAINRLVATLLSQDPTSSHAADLRLMQEAGRRLSSLVEDILDVALLERGRLSLTRKAFAPRAMLEGAAALVLPGAEAQGLGFDVRLDEALPALALGDEERLRQVVVKLLENAVKFTWAGSVQLSADLLDEDDMGWRLGIAVTDTGVGISPPAQGELFEPFFQADSSRSRRYEGAGLGLAVCRMLLEAMGGSISVESEEGCGSTFRCEVPLRQVSATAALSAASGQVAGHPA